MPFPSTFAILRGSFVDAKSPAGVQGYEKPEYLVILNAVKDTTDPMRPLYRVIRSNGGNANLDKNWPAKVGVSSCRITWGDGIMFDGSEPPQPVKTKYCLLPLNVTFFSSNGMVESCPVLSFERTFWMGRADKGMAHLSYREVGTEVVPMSLLWQSWVRAKMPLPAALKAAQDAFNGLCHKEEAVRRINAVYNDFAAGLDGNAVVPEVPMSIIERTRTLNLPEVALRRMKTDLPAVCDFLGTYSHLVSTPWFVTECTRLGNTGLINHICNLVFSHDHAANIAKKIVNDYACAVMDYPSGTFDDMVLRFEMNVVSRMFQDHCLSFVNSALEEILHAYRLNQQHQHSQQESDEFWEAERIRIADIDEAARQDAIRVNRNVYEAYQAYEAQVAAEEDELYRQRQEEDEQIEDYIEENRQEMAERNEAQMEAAEAEERATTDGVNVVAATAASHSREDLFERVNDAAQTVRQAILDYSRLRKEAKVSVDDTIPRLRGMWIKKPTADGYALEETEADEIVTGAEVREGADGCPWPYFVYANHAKVEIDKGAECPISMIPLASCKNINVSMNCGHIYESKAITAWTNITGARDANCPTCRAPIAGMWRLSVKPRVPAASGGGNN